MSTYKIKSGDTLSQIAKKYNTTVKTLQNINNIADPNKIRAGKSLNVGIPKPGMGSARKVNPYAGQTKKSMAAMAMKKKPAKKLFRTKAKRRVSDQPIDPNAPSKRVKDPVKKKGLAPVKMGTKRKVATKKQTIKKKLTPAQIAQKKMPTKSRRGSRSGFLGGLFK